MSHDISDRRHAVAEEQAFLDLALARHAAVLAQLEAEIAAAPADDVGRARSASLRRRHAELRHAGEALVFGRLDAADGKVRHIGRIGLHRADPGLTGTPHDASSTPSEDNEPLVLDWRAPASRPFYTATPLHPQGQARRRHVRVDGPTVTGVDDEPLDHSHDGRSSRAAALVGEGALLSALGQRRTGRMTTAIATLQREQDDIVRADADGPLIVQGGPGTGKTVVALHRVAYLLFTHRRMADQAVLVLGPSARFLDYITQVLPALGETAVVSTTCDDLVPGVRVQREESRVLAEIKGRSSWQAAIESLVAEHRPTATDLTAHWDGEEFVVPAAQVTHSLAAVAARPYHDARRVFSEQFRQILTDAVVERREAMLTEVEEGYEDILEKFDRSSAAPGGPAGGASGVEVDGALTEDDVEELRERIAGSAAVDAVLTAWWPDLDPAPMLRRLLSSPQALRRHAPHLTDDEIALIAAEPEGWSPGDVPLLDALADALGEPTPPPAPGEFIADRARAQRGWVYGHVVVDEAQELSEMQWRMVLRRCPSRSVTAVGDIDQAEASHRHTSWAQAVRSTFGDRWRAAELTICYRTPREVMDLTGPVLEKAGSRNSPPRAVRSSGVTPWEETMTEDEIPARTAQLVAGMRERWAGGTVGVVTTAARAGALTAALPGVPVLTATGAKGLEWDATLVVDPAGITAGPRGWNGLYVALTRCTQELGQVHVTPESSRTGGIVSE
ncbi:AAA family ATPase [Kineosporia sp. J2-2]|uniref:AAA family ATPase n=1 Tax=Kineosporia corallincola TaxID=2835133 RepID=A0ABS5TK80_9ACTN|nr:UvrD-helicase domain-containing protein [Kineosporia corallincola]MBT0771510.1 AAA family ATPase [Kineosporia corallincola]